jgi:Zn-dependent protease/CBS domain-containing protein
VRPEGLAIARIAGIEIRVSLAWVLLLALVTILAADISTGTAPQLGQAVHWVVGASSAIGVLICVLAHELAHALAARRMGVEATTVVLGFIGGLAPFEIQGRRPRDEIVIALVGPLVSLGIAAVLVPTGLALLDRTDLLAAVGAGLLVIGTLDLALAVLSLLPGLPLDGGRIVRALAWARTHDPRLAGRLAARLGRMTGWLLGGLGVFVALAADPPTGVMLFSLGWFVSSGASAVDRRLTIETVLEGVRVADAMERDLPHVAPQLTVDVFADRYVPGGPATTLPVLSGDRVLGVIGLERIRRLGRRAWPQTRAEDIMVSPPSAPLLDPDSPLWDAVETLRRSGVDGLAVVATEAGEAFAGVLTRRGATQAIRDRLQQRAGGRV